jgi:hypothetical protein
VSKNPRHCTIKDFRLLGVGPVPGIGDDFQSAVGQLIAEEFVVPDGGELILSPFFMPSTTGLPLTAAGQPGGRLVSYSH